MASNILEFLMAFVRHWIGWGSGSLIASGLGIVDYTYGWRLPKKIYILFLAIGIFVSCFFAWNDQHSLYLSAKNDVDAARGEIKRLTGQIGERDKRIDDLRDKLGFRPTQTSGQRAIGDSLKQRALRFANRVKMFADQQQALYVSKDLNFYPDDKQLAQKLENERNERAVAVTRQFAQIFDAELAQLISGFQKSGTDTTAIVRLRRIATGIETDKDNYPFPTSAVGAVAAQLKDLAGQIDDNGFLVH